MAIPISERLTIVAGHNGIGKSTILGLLANGSGLTGGTGQGSAEQTSYFNRLYQGNLNDIIHIDFESEWEQVESLDLPAPKLVYEVDGRLLTKRCALTQRSERREVRVVPRSVPHKAFVSDTGIRVGSDGKVPLPTIYLGMTRMLPIGEADPEWVKTAADTTIDGTDGKFIRDFIAKIIYLSTTPEDGTITTQTITGTTKVSKHPAYSHSTRAISLGQDSLSSIATALASFRRLKREWNEYPGGLLVIDELDAGFHPHAQRELVKNLKSVARNLSLQIVATSHSMTLIEAVHPDLSDAPDKTLLPDSVVYLADTARPRLLPIQSVDAIRRDMNLEAPGAPTSRTPEIKAYLEDPEAYFILKRLLTRKFRSTIKSEVGVRIAAIPLSAGCENLKGFVKKDDYFKTVVIVVDADSGIGPRSAKNICQLPGERSGARGLSPEGTLFNFLKRIADGGEVDAQNRLFREAITTDQIRANLLDGKEQVGDREAAKAWFNLHADLISDWKIVELWAELHSDEVEKFQERFLDCVREARTAGLKYVL